MANRYWVGGTGTWDASDTTHWSTTSGGAGGASVPTVADAVIFNASSGGGTATLGATANCLTINFAAFTGTFDFSTYDINVSGNAATIINLNTTIAAINGTGKFNCVYSGSTGTRTITIGTGASTKAASVAVSAGSDTLAFTSSAQMIDIDFTGFSGTWTTSSSTNIYGNLKLSAGMTVGSLAGAITFAATTTGKTITTNAKTIDQAITFNGIGGSWQLQDNLTIGSTRTVLFTNGALDLNSKTLSCGVFSSSNSNTRTLAYGTGNITVTGSGTTVYNLATTTGLTITGTPVVNLTYAGSTGTRLVYNGINAKTVNINVSAGSDTVTFNNTFYYTNIDFTGFSGTWTSSSTGEIYGNLTISSGMTVGELGTSAKQIAFLGTGITQTITTSEEIFDCNLVFNGVGTTFTFADALTQGSTREFTITNGTVKLKAGATSTVGAFATSGSNQKYLQSTTAGSQATLSQASGTVTVSYLSIKDIAATGGATWNAYVDYNNVDQGDNTGWDFSYSPAIDNEFPIALRSFTQPKRF